LSEGLGIYGIRHHGPGSARAVLDALILNPPKALVVEMPADLQTALYQIGAENLQPPVALTAYDPKSVSTALYYPLARFSPEWVAMRWAADNEVTIHAMDLPSSLMIALSQNEKQQLDLKPNAKKYRRVRRDPLGELAKLAGYADRERWWERTFEIQNPGAGIFEHTTEMIRMLRQSYPEATDAECKLREMHMAKTILSLQKQGVDNIAVVCGAWHAPALQQDVLTKTAKGYAAAKRGLKGPKLEVTWIPWTYERLRSEGGYGAGVQSPVWYGLLFDGPRLAPEHYLTLMAMELRAMGQAASTAQVVDATELADQLAELRDLVLPGLDEIQEAALGTLAEGSQARLEAIRKNVESYRTTGRVPENFSSLPLQRDLEKRLKSVRLMKPYRDMERVEKNLDLRKEKHLQASQLLCQLLLLGIPFGSRDDASLNAKGTFKETWTLHWHPDFALSLLACHVYGVEVPEAAAAALRARMDEESDLASLTKVVDLIILAGLFDELQDVARRMREQAIATLDVWLIARALPPLLRLVRYDSIHTREADFLYELTDTLVPKLASGIAAAGANVDDDAAYDGFRLLKLVQPYLAMLEEDAHLRLWYSAVERLAYANKTHPLLAGWALRTLVDAGKLDQVETSKFLRLNLGTGIALNDSAMFVEGFLYSSALVLLHQPMVFKVLDAWIDTLDPEPFRSLLPALRRTFSQFPPNERRKLSALLQNPGQDTEQDVASELDLSEGLVSALRGWL